MSPDVVIVGAGLAGAAAAARLTAEGLGVVVLEARDRTGGRGYCRPFAGSDEEVDFGGAWITPWQSRIRGLCDRHAVALRPRAPVTARRWFRDGKLHVDGPSSEHDRRRHETALAQLTADAALYKLGRSEDAQGHPIAGISFAAYIDRLDAPASTRELLSAWWTVSGNGDKARVPASELLTSCGHGDGTPDGICEVWTDTLEGGVSLLVERLLEASAAEVRLASPVAGISIAERQVAVRLVSGEVIRAKAAILATGVNPLRAIGFKPPLSAAKRDALVTGHLGRAVKVWAKVHGVPVGILATGGGSGIELMLSERTTGDGATLLVGFGGVDGPVSHEGLARAAVARFFPEARLIAVDGHDWNADPYALGTWVASVVGAEAGLRATTWASEGRLAFATSDTAREDAGWFEGAIIAGEDAADALLGALGTL